MASRNSKNDSGCSQQKSTLPTGKLSPPCMEIPNSDPAAITGCSGICS